MGKNIKQIKYIKFESSNCPGCKKLSNALEVLGSGQVVETYNIETLDGMVMADKYQVRSVPVLIKLENDEEIDRMQGFNLPEFRRLMGD